MEATPLKISRTDFESAVPAAKMKNDSVFLMLLSKFETAYVDLVQEMLGSVGEDAALGGENTMLLLLAKTMVCQRTFIDNFRSLDVVLTATGFGVVSTQDLTPASKARVDALLAQCEVEALRTRDRLLTCLFSVEGWNLQVQRRTSVPNLFYRFSFLSSLAGMPHPSEADWQSATALAAEADAFLRLNIGDELVDLLLSQLTSNSLSEKNQKAVAMAHRVMGFHISGIKAAEKEHLRRLVDMIERDLESFSEYAASRAYQSRHFAVYENTKESTAFFFQG